MVYTTPAEGFRRPGYPNRSASIPTRFTAGSCKEALFPFSHGIYLHTGFGVFGQWSRVLGFWV